MVLVMVITSLHMNDPLNSSIVIFRFAFVTYILECSFSIISGRLVDRWGRGPVIVTGSATLVLACLAATISPDVLPLALLYFY